MEYKYPDITQSIISSALEVHKTFGNGFQEVIYQRAPDIELVNHKLLVGRKIAKILFCRWHTCTSNVTISGSLLFLSGIRC